jgi:hypothetical protein
MGLTEKTIFYLIFKKWNLAIIIKIFKLKPGENLE